MGELLYRIFVEGREMGLFGYTIIFLFLAYMLTMVEGERNSLSRYLHKRLPHHSKFRAWIGKHYPTVVDYGDPDPDQQAVNVAVIACYDEDPVALSECVSSMRESLIESGVNFQFIGIIDGIDSEEEIRKSRSGIKMIRIFQENNLDKIIVHGSGSKRSGIELVHQYENKDYPITALIDSDTRMMMLNGFRILLGNFKNPKIGVVTPAQDIHKPFTLAQRFASLQERARRYSSMPAQSLHGNVGCAPGRLILYRNDIMNDATLQEFMHHKVKLWFNKEPIEMLSGDDRELTWRAILKGYLTMFDPRVLVETDAPETLSRLILQQDRWFSTSTLITNLCLWRKEWRGPFLRQKMMAFCFIRDNITPFLVVLLLCLSLYNVLFGAFERSLLLTLSITTTSVTLLMFSKQIRQFWNRILYGLLMSLPWAVFIFFEMMPQKAYRTIFPKVTSWGTRKVTYGGKKKEFLIGRDWNP